MHLPHPIGAVDLHHDFADAEFGGDLLVKPSRGHVRQHFFFANAEQVVVLAHRRDRFLLAAPGAIALKRGKDGVKQLLIVEWLGQEIDGARLHGADRHGDVPMAGHEDNRNLHVGPGKLFLQLEAAHFGHAHVEHYATGCIRNGALEKLSGRSQ